MITRIAEPPFVAFRKGRISLEIRACQVVEQNIEAGIEEIAPTADQMIKQGNCSPPA
jgi:hypothetical protein